jgi:hypothetical protein
MERKWWTHTANIPAESKRNGTHCLQDMLLSTMELEEFINYLASVILNTIKDDYEE